MNNENFKTVNLDCGWPFKYIVELDGGGLKQKYDFLKLIKEFGNPPYDHAFEWCAGFGAIGYELLGSELCKNIHFSDYYDPAIQNCIINAELNNVKDKVFTYLSDNIKDINSNYKWDLVVGNPPHRFDKEKLVNWYLERDNKKSIDELDHLKHDFRTLLDADMKIHKEFFENIRSKLNDGADIFLTEILNHGYIPDLIKTTDIKFINCYPTSIQSLGMYHFKAV